MAPHCSEALYPCTDACLVAVACACSELWLDAGLQAGPSPFTMGVDQPNKRAAEQAGKKGKPARKAAANTKSTACASKPAHAAATSSSTSLPLHVMPHVFSFATYAVRFVCSYLVCLLFLDPFSCAFKIVQVWMSEVR